MMSPRPATAGVETAVKIRVFSSAFQKLGSFQNPPSPGWKPVMAASASRPASATMRPTVIRRPTAAWIAMATAVPTMRSRRGMRWSTDQVISVPPSMRWKFSRPIHRGGVPSRSQLWKLM